MSRIVITIELPDNASISVAPAAVSPPAAGVASYTPQQVMEQGAQIFGVDWPTGKCPKHDRPWKPGQRGPFCSAKDESTASGYCIVVPGAVWNGRTAR